MADFKFDKRALERVVNDGMKDIAKKMQGVFDGVYRTYESQPVDVVKPALKSAMRRAEFTPDDAQLDSWSTAISAGTRIVVKPENTRL